MHTLRNKLNTIKFGGFVLRLQSRSAPASRFHPGFSRVSVSLLALILACAGAAHADIWKARDENV